MGVGRQARVATAIKEAVAEFLILNLANATPGFITVSNAKVSPDLRVATVYFSIIGNEKDVEFTFKELERQKSRIRYHVGQEVPLKYVPEIRFFLDDSQEYVAKIKKVMKKL